MTRDDSGEVDDRGDPGSNLDAAEVIICQECNNVVRRVNSQHLQSGRCRYTYRDTPHKEEYKREDHPETVEDYKDKHSDAPVISPAERKRIKSQNSSEEADERRREMMERRWNGEDMSRIKESIANKHDVTPRTVRRDWANRDEWIGRVFGIEEAETIVAESLAQKKDIRRRLMRAASQAEHQEELGHMVRALKAVDDNIDDMIDNLTETGLIEGAVERHEVALEGKVEHEHRTGDAGEELDEATMRDLDALTGGDDDEPIEEVVDAEYREVESDA